MAEHKRIGAIDIVTDSETSYDKIGDVDGGFDEVQLKRHIEKFGHEGLCEKLTIMQWQIWETVRAINAERDKNQSCYCGAPVDKNNSDCVNFGLCSDHADDA